MSDDEHKVPHGEWINVDGVSAHVSGQEPMSDEGRAAVADVVRAAHARMASTGTPTKREPMAREDFARTLDAIAKSSLGIRPNLMVLDPRTIAAGQRGAAKALKRADRLTAAWVTLPWWRFRYRRALQDAASDALKLNRTLRSTFGWADDIERHGRCPVLGTHPVGHNETLRINDETTARSAYFADNDPGDMRLDPDA